MGFIKFDKNELINLEYSLTKEMLRSNRAGSFSCNTIIGCNTRKYHGLLICPQPLLGNTIHVLLSKLDETIIQRDAEFNIGINRFPGTYMPKGHKYVRDFSADIIPKITYRVGGVVLTKETLFVTEQEKVMIRYTLVEAQSPTTLRIRPFLAFRNIHSLSKKNIYLDTKYEPVANGVKARMYDGYSPLYMQLSKSKAEYVHSPDWYNDLEYYQEMDRGYEHHEDLYVPGFFEFPIKKGESVIFCAGTQEINPGVISKLFNKELNARTPRNSFENCLANSAEQFFYTHERGTDIIAGYPWYDRIGRYTFLTLPGLSLARNSEEACRSVIDTMIGQMSRTFFPETGRGENTRYHSADTSLWFVRAIQLCCCQGKNIGKVWKLYGNVIKSILESYAAGNNLLAMRNNSLIYINPDFQDVTWMNATREGKAVTPRYGYVVEVNALWYNAIRFAVDAAKADGNKAFVKKWTTIADNIPVAFADVFINNENGYLYDYVADDYTEAAVRPNAVIAASLPWCPMPDAIVKRVLDTAIKQLLTPKGLRTLPPDHPFYKGRYKGNERQRDLALHQGTVYPWLLGPFAEAYLKIYKEKGRDFVKKLLENFHEDMTVDGIGTISELYDGDPPHSSRGAISFAASVAELLRVQHLLDEMEKVKK